MSNKDLKVPNIGDFKDVEVIEVLVNEGDNITKNDPLITIESDKSSVEIPSIYSGKIEKLSSTSLKRTWVNNNQGRDWLGNGEGKEFLRHATDIKNIWIPYGE